MKDLEKLQEKINAFHSEAIKFFNNPKNEEHSLAKNIIFSHMKRIKIELYAIERAK